jgi:hypothetical protein
MDRLKKWWGPEKLTRFFPSTAVVLHVVMMAFSVVVRSGRHILLSLEIDHASILGIHRIICRYFGQISIMVVCQSFHSYK